MLSLAALYLLLSTSPVCATGDSIALAERIEMDRVASLAIDSAVRAGLGQQFGYLGPLQHLRVTHRFIVQPTSTPWVTCGDSTDLDAWVRLASAPKARQAYVMTEADVINNTAGFVVWLADDNGRWRARTVTFSIVATAGKSLAALRAMVLDEHAKHHDFNAIVLGSAAVLFLPTDDHFRLGIDTLLRQEVAHLPAISVFSGPPPWHFGEFTIVGIGPIGIGNALHLVVAHEVDPWMDDGEPDRRNKRLIAALKAEYPEYASVFGSLIVRALERGTNRGFATVDPPSP